MMNTSLRDFASRAAANGRIRFGDLRRLQRNVLPNGIGTREEAEALLDLDQSVSRADPDWPGWLSSALKAFAISRDGVDTQKVAWLADRLAARRTKAAQALARQLTTEARHDAESDASAEVRSGLPIMKPMATSSVIPDGMAGETIRPEDETTGIHRSGGLGADEACAERRALDPRDQI
jgi:hypothetical protein